MKQQPEGDFTFRLLFAAFVLLLSSFKRLSAPAIGLVGAGAFTTGAQQLISQIRRFYRYLLVKFVYLMKLFSIKHCKFGLCLVYFNYINRKSIIRRGFGAWG